VNKLEFSSISRKKIHRFKKTAPKWKTFLVHILPLVSFVRRIYRSSVQQFVHPCDIWFVRPTKRPSVRQIVGPSDKSFVRPIDRSSVARATRRWVWGAQCCFPFVLFGCRDRGVCACSHGLLDLKSAGRRATFRSISFVYQAGGAENRFEGSDGRLHHFHSPEEVDPLTARSGRLFRFYAPKFWFSLWRSLPICYILQISVKEFMLQNISDKSVIALELVLCIRFWTSFFAMRERRGWEEKWGGRSTVPLFVYKHVLSGVV
jgi:hypothetical protein